MTHVRTIAWTLLAAGGFALFAPSAAAQPEPALPLKPSPSLTVALRDAPRGGIPKEKLKEAREAFKKFATYYADVVKHPAVWRAPTELKSVGPATAPIPTLDGPEGILRDIDRFLIEPGVSRTTNLE